MTDLAFAYPSALLLLALIPLLVAWYSWRGRKQVPDVRFPHAGLLEGSGWRVRMRHVPFGLRMLVLALLILVVARPQSASHGHEVDFEGIDIMIALDISGSMLAEDFQPNRMEAAKRTAVEFVAMRPGDRIGASVFSGQSFTLCPLTTDHALLKELISGAHTGMVEDGTAIGDGLATALNRLRESPAVSRVIVLLTDGINNTGVIDPLTAAEMAALYEVRVYTIGVGSSGPVPYPFQTPAGIRYQDVEIPVDEELLKEIAQITDGRYFWADQEDKLREIYAEIDQLERSRISVSEWTRKTDRFRPFLLLALSLLLIEILLRNTWLRATT